MKSVVSITAVLLLTLAGISAAQTPVYRFQAGKNYTYLMELKGKSIEDYMGQVFNTSIDGTATMITSLVKAFDDGSQLCMTQVENSLFTFDTPQGVQTFDKTANGMKCIYTLGINGKIDKKDITISMPKGKQMQFEFHPEHQFIPLYADKMKVGESWEVELHDTTDTGDELVTSDGTMRFTVKGSKMIGTISCLEIMMESEATLSGSTTMGNEEARLSGDMKTTATFLYNVTEGLVIEAIREETVDKTISPLSMPSQKMRTTQSVSGKYRLLKE